MVNHHNLAVDEVIFPLIKSFTFYLICFSLCTFTGLGPAVITFTRHKLLANSKDEILTPILSEAVVSRLVSCINAALCLYGAFQMIFLDPVGWEATYSPEVAVWSTGFNNRAVYLALFGGYIAYDLVICLALTSLRDLPTIFHHTVILAGLFSTLVFDMCTLYIAVLMFSEVSTLFLNLSYFLLKARCQTTNLYFFNGCCLLITFFIFRVLLITGVLLHVLFAWWKLGFVKGLVYAEPFWRVSVVAMLSLLVVLHWFINIYWFGIIFNRSRCAFKNKTM